MSHEEGSVYEFLRTIYDAAGREDLFGYCDIDAVTGQLPDNIQDHVPRPKVDSTKLSVRTPKDYRDMRNQAQRKGEPEAKVFVTEVKKVRHFRFHL